MKFHETRLANGLQILFEENPRAQSVAFGFFVRTGARDETTAESGVSHFLEHMVFKGTDRYSAESVNRLFDEVGANYNASTSEEVTMFYAAVLPEYLPETFALKADLMFPALRGTDFDTEKQVILEEIGMYADQPMFVAYDRVMQVHFQGHPLGLPILGTTESIEALAVEKMREYHARRYHAGNIVLAVAGNTKWEAVLELATRHCAHWPAGRPERPTAEPVPAPQTELITRPDLLQEQVMQLGSAPAADDPLRYEAELLSVIVGDDVNSRLYWELIEPGLAEVAEVSYNEYDGCGSYLTYLACDPELAGENLAKIAAIYDEVNRDGVTADELAQARTKVATRLVLRSERPMGRLSSLGHDWLARGEYQPVEQEVAAIEAVTLDSLNALLRRYPLTQTTTVAVGPLRELGQAPSAALG